MPKVSTHHRTVSSSQNCPLCGQIMRNIEKGRRLTPGQGAHAANNVAIIEERAQTEILAVQAELARQGSIFDDLR